MNIFATSPEARQLHSDMIAHKMALVAIGREMSKLDSCPLCVATMDNNFCLHHNEHCPIDRAVHQYKLWLHRQSEPLPDPQEAQ